MLDPLLSENTEERDNVTMRNHEESLDKGEAVVDLAVVLDFLIEDFTEDIIFFVL